MLVKINKQLNRFIPLMAPISVVLGVLLSDYFTNLTSVVPWIFAFITFSGSLGSTFKSLYQTISNPIPILILLVILHIVMPMWATLVGHITFNNDIYTISGLILSVVIPTGITSFIWVSIHKGNIALTFTIVLIDTILSPFLVPMMLSLFIGKSVELEVWNMMSALIGMVVIPSILAMVLNAITKGHVHKVWSPRLEPLSKLGLMLVIMINSAVVAPYLSNINKKLLLISLIVFLVSASGYILSLLTGKLLKYQKEDVIAFTFSGGMRNISAGSVIAVAFFPPPVALPVVIGMLFQQVIASFFGYILERTYSKKLYVDTNIKVEREG
ncbi:bile acid:sodium symporter family protein [Metabacillus sp. B2-18]|uniref:bile acid:sodium symporter family protein n=1 Tax=Metabacillus sp. B2-18 TaxID=2897333 RepID=UPI001E31183E|nr:bile acid:sodium symporter family protein [Metabacillus sp. B2-18]UGB32221.1 bile acid:sodium symporter family protein [Metabacillus sp. B2-18]